jgi:TonB family protein
VQSLSLQTSVASDGGQLLTRIRRLIGARKPQRVAAHWSIGVMLAMVAVSISGLLQPLGSSPREQSDDLMQASPVEATRLPETVPSSGDSGAAGSQFSLSQLALSQAAPLAPVHVPELLDLPGAGDTLSPPNTEAVATAERGIEGRANATGPIAAGAGASHVTSPESAPTARTEPLVTAQTADASVQSKLAADTAVPTEAVVVTAPSAAIAGSSPPAGSVVDRVRMAAVDRAAQENGVELVWLNPPVVGDQSGAAAEAGLEEGQAADGARFNPARAMAILQPQPEFPDKARQNSIEGWVTVSYLIGRDGRVSNVDIVAAQPRNVFESAVRRAVRSWRFEPMTVDGATVEQQKTQTIRFSLSDVQPPGEEVCAYSTGSRICRPNNR